LDKPKILIIGAGIAGLSLAQKLQAGNITFTIVEKQISPSIDGTGIALPFNAVRALKNLGIYDQVMPIAHQVKQVRYTMPSGDTLAAAELTNAPFESDQFIALTRSSLHKILLQGIKEQIHFGCYVHSIVAHPTGSEVICSKSKLSGRYDLVIAADGVNSGTRNSVLGHIKTVYDHNVMTWRFLSDWPSHQLQPTYMFGKTDVFMAYPISEDSLYCYAQISKNSKKYNGEISAIENIERIFSHHGNPAKTIIANIGNTKITSGSLKSVTQARYFHHRVAFIGDAANACSPLLEQGAAAAFEDAICLAHQIESNNIDEALRNYRAIRKARIEWVIHYSNRPLHNIENMERPIVRGIRNLMIKTLGPLNLVGWKKLARQPKLAFPLSY